MKVINIKLFVLAISFLFLMYNVNETYSRYISNVEGEVAFNFAKWQVLVNDENITSNYESKLKFTPVIDENDNMAPGTFGPTSTGHFDIEIDPSNVSMSYMYTIDISKTKDSEVSNAVVTHYAIATPAQIASNASLTKYAVSNSTTSISKVEKWSNTSGFKFNKFVVRIYFAWNDDLTNTSDDEDTIVGTKAANNEKINFNILATLKFKQYVE